MRPQTPAYPLRVSLTKPGVDSTAIGVKRAALTLKPAPCNQVLTAWRLMRCNPVHWSNGGRLWPSLQPRVLPCFLAASCDPLRPRVLPCCLASHHPLPACLHLQTSANRPFSLTASIAAWCQLIMCVCVYVCMCVCMYLCVYVYVCVCVCVCIHYRLLTLCPAPTDPVGQSWPRGTGSVGDSVGEGYPGARGQ